MKYFANGDGKNLALQWRKNSCFFLLMGVVYFFMYAPFLIFGENIVPTVHDSLDIGVGWLKMYKHNDLFFQFNAPTKGFDEISTIFYGGVNFSFPVILNQYCNVFAAYVVNYFLSTICGALFMYILLVKILKTHKLLLFMVSIIFAFLPVVKGWDWGIATLPLIILVFMSLWTRDNFTWQSVLLLLFPFFSNFTAVGVFILGFWLLGMIVSRIKQKKLNMNLLVGFVALCFGYVLVDLRLFYVMFVVREPLNRSIFTYSANFFSMFRTYALHGYYHATTMQRPIILPTVFCLSSYFALTTLLNIKKKPIAMMDTRVKLLFTLDFVLILFSAIAALYDSKILAPMIKKIIPMLDGFNWGRIFILNRVVWFVVFALCLDIILRMRNTDFDFDTSGFYKRLPINKFIAYSLLLGQLAHVVLPPVMYNDQVKTWFNELAIKTGIAKKITGRDYEKFISYREFFSEQLFNKIKEDIAYRNEKVVAFGYHPSVLMYNGFNCIDGYNNAYPLSYMKKFRTLIAPELATNEQAQKYYDSWGGRMYLYNTGPNDGLNFNPTRKKDIPPATLNIDMNVFKNDFGGKYILSRAEFSNSSELGLKLIGTYDDEESIYRIYLYAL